MNPDDICDQYGADTLRMYEMFLGPIEQSKPWSTRGISGVHSFLKKFWNLFFLNGNFNVSKDNPSEESIKILNQTIKKVTNDIEKFSLNTCVSSFMICINKLSEEKCNNESVLKQLLILISPFAPHFAEELWSLMGNKESILDEPFPIHDDSVLVYIMFMLYLPFVHTLGKKCSSFFINPPTSCIRVCVIIVSALPSSSMYCI